MDRRRSCGPPRLVHPRHAWRACRFKAGAQALLLATADLGSGERPAPLGCTVVESGQQGVRVVLPADAAAAVLGKVKHLRSAGRPASVRLDLSVADPTFRRQTEALDSLGNACDESNENEVRRGSPTSRIGSKRPPVERP